MKPLLRAVLIIDALLLLAFGLLFLLTPWKSLYDALQLVQTDPALVGQGAGIALIGLAWLALHASIDGAMTATTAKVVGHVNWLTGLLMLVWLVGLHTPQLTGFGQLVAVLTGVVLLVIGLGGVKLSSAVKRRERLAGTAAVERTDRVAARDAENEARKAERERDAARTGVVYPATTGPHVEPTLAATPVSPATGHPVEPGLTAQPPRATMPEAAAAAREDALAHERRAEAHEDAAARERAAAQRNEADARAAEAKSGTPRPPFHG
ncbi:hypothetical protein [Paraburkholderia hospita]|jgi:hypothetical protein|uniref:hypothetical protein n=1 Tax=Paraburkholderia hospita TaxID=169430 RepID=UPI000271C836|nr:hypothetical protein [Paraburkholderia hospita]EUC18131.1 hypothetical protein PMI06_003763 [Burkholderia sp. BT03]SKC74736.1 hypothetical protein SAMN05445504_1787 [Burkholderia sp. CF099]AXE98189.1 hypothetical protein CUJ88_06675 [Paraburkholderia hospita]OUL71632.1 hypothetical protein CA603_46870 [Paraburkholderia hospita]SKC90208.1 hypothetical protein SAMN06266956_4490 [Paraburkholderia hospita]